MKKRKLEIVALGILAISLTSNFIYAENGYSAEQTIVPMKKCDDVTLSCPSSHPDDSGYTNPTPENGNTETGMAFAIGGIYYLPSEKATVTYTDMREDSETEGETKTLTVDGAKIIVVEGEDIEATDSNGRSSSDILEIVNQNSETITLKVIKYSPEGESNPETSTYPEWTITDESDKKGETVMFSAESLNIPGPINWLATIDPITYDIETEDGCSLTVKAYPGSEKTVSLNFSKLSGFLDKLANAGKAINPDMKFVFPQGKISFSNQWKECPNTEKANWTYKVNAGFDPLFGIEGSIPITPPIPATVRKYVDIGIYLVFGGGISLSGQFEKNEYGKTIGSIPLSGKVMIGVKGVVKVVNDDFLNIEVSGTGTVVGSGNISVSDNFMGLKKVTVKSPQVEGSLKISLVYGLWDVEEKVVLLDAKTLYGPAEINLKPQS